MHSCALSLKHVDTVIDLSLAASIELGDIGIELFEPELGLPVLALSLSFLFSDSIRSTVSFSSIDSPPYCF